MGFVIFVLLILVAIDLLRWFVSTPTYRVHDASRRGRLERERFEENNRATSEVWAPKNPIPQIFIPRETPPRKWTSQY